MIAQMQKRARGISRVGRRLFPNLRTTGLPAAWSQLLDDPITALDRRLASVTSDPTTASEENSNGTMIDWQSQIARPDHRINRSLDHPIYASQGLGDPITGLDEPLGSIAPVPTPDSEENINHRGHGGTQRNSKSNSIGTMTNGGESQQAPASSQAARPDHQVTRSPDHPIQWPDLPIPRSPDVPIQGRTKLAPSIASVPMPDSEEHSTGTMIDSPRPHTFRQPQQSLASSQITYDPGIASVPTPASEEHSTGTMIDGSRRHPFRQPQQSLASSQIAYDPAIASAPTPDPEEYSTGTMVDGSSRHTFRQQPLVSSQTARQDHPITRSPDLPIKGLFPDLGVTGLPPAFSRVLRDPITALDRLLAPVTSVPKPESDENINHRGHPSAFASRAGSGTQRNSKSNSTGTMTNSGELQQAPASSQSARPDQPIPRSPDPPIPWPDVPISQPGRTKLVPFSRLAEMLAPHGPAGESSVQPHTFEPTEAAQTAPAGSSPPSQPMTVEAVLEQLGQRLQFEFLRTYGSSGE